MKVKILDTSSGVPLKVNKIYPVKFEEKNHYIIINEENIFCGIYKYNVEVVNDFEELESGQLKFDL